MAMSKLAILTSAFIPLIVIYSLVMGEPLCQFSLASYKFAIMVSVISIVIHLNALFRQKDMRLLLKFSFFVPLAVIAYFIIGLIHWYISGI